MEPSIPVDQENMVQQQLIRRGIHDPRVLDAMRQVPREHFVPDLQKSWSLHDGPLPIGSGQTISQPYVVAFMTELLNLKGGETVLEIGTGSGYQAAILSLLAQQIHSVEVLPELAQQAQSVLEELFVTNISIHVGDGSLGWPEAAPYQGIIVTAAAPAPPAPLLEQLATDGRLVIPVGTRVNQNLQLWWHEESGFEHEDVLPVSFVPLRGKFGWKDGEW